MFFTNRYSDQWDGSQLKDTSAVLRQMK